MQPNVHAMKSLEQLSKEYMEAMAAEALARQARRKIGDEIAALVAADRDEGTVSRDAGRWRVTVTKKLSRRLDLKKWEEVRRLVPEGLEPVRCKVELDLRKYRAIAQANPALLATINRAVITKPAAPSVSVEPIEEPGEVAA